MFALLNFKSLSLTVVIVGNLRGKKYEFFFVIQAGIKIRKLDQTSCETGILNNEGAVILTGELQNSDFDRNFHI